MTVAENLEMQALPIRKPAGARPGAHRARPHHVPPPGRAALAAGRDGSPAASSSSSPWPRRCCSTPQVLCIDELSLGLAPVVVGELLEIVRRLHDEGITLVVVEQSLNIAAQLCERAVFLEKGQVRFEGRTAELLEQDDIARAVFFGGAVQSNGDAPNAATPAAVGAQADVREELMRPFQEFRLWARRAPVERTGRRRAWPALIVVALLAWLVVPDGDDVRRPTTCRAGAAPTPAAAPAPRGGDDAGAGGAAGGRRRAGAGGGGGGGGGGGAGGAGGGGGGAGRRRRRRRRRRTRRPPARRGACRRPGKREGDHRHRGARSPSC